MKLLIVCMLTLTTVNAWSDSDVKKFNKVLLDKVNHDIAKDESQFKKSPMRGPASVKPEAVPAYEEKKIDKNNQLGSKNW